MTQPNNALHGITLEKLLTNLVEHYGWEDLGARIDIRCFNHEPSIKGTSNNCLRPLAFRLVRNQGASLPAGWLPVKKAQRRVRASLKAPAGTA